MRFPPRPDAHLARYEASDKLSEARRQWRRRNEPLSGLMDLHELLDVSRRKTGAVYGEALRCSAICSLFFVGNESYWGPAHAMQQRVRLFPGLSGAARYYQGGVWLCEGSSGRVLFCLSCQKGGSRRWRHGLIRARREWEAGVKSRGRSRMFLN